MRTNIVLCSVTLPHNVDVNHRTECVRRCRTPRVERKSSLVGSQNANVVKGVRLIWIPNSSYSGRTAGTRARNASTTRHYSTRRSHARPER